MPAEIESNIHAMKGITMNNEEKILELLEQHGKLLGDIQSDVSGLKADVSGLKADVSGLKADVSDLKADVSDLKTRVAKIEITQENVILPSLQALAEGQKTILETLAPKSRVEALEDEMVFMKSVIKALTQEIAELKKAQ